MLKIDAFSPDYFHNEMLYRSINHLISSQKNSLPESCSTVFLLPDDSQCLALSFLPKLLLSENALVLCTDRIYRILTGLLYGKIIFYPELAISQKIFINALINKLISEMYANATRNIAHYANKISPSQLSFRAQIHHLNRLLQQLAVAERVVGFKRKNEQTVSHVFGFSSSTSHR